MSLDLNDNLFPGRDILRNINKINKQHCVLQASPQYFFCKFLCENKFLAVADEKYCSYYIKGTAVYSYYMNSRK